MDRAEAAGLGVATAGHLALLAALTYGVAATRLPVPKSDPIEVAFVDETGLESTVPTPSAVEPAPLAGIENGPPVPAMPSPREAEQVPAPQTQPQAQPPPRAAMPAPKPVPAPKPRPAPPKASATPKPRPAPPTAPAAPSKQATPRRTASGLNSVVAGLSDRPSSSKSTTPLAAVAGPDVKASLGRLVREQLRPHWKSPSGADAELLRTELSIWLGRDGSVTRVEVLGTTGQTASNRPQVKLHQEQAVRAARLASPFKLPDNFYEAWKYLSPIGFDRKLSR